ncbi:LacI family DNA-binding transcriptional regulator [Bacillus sp. N1-1]|jgi:LacI family transcriptional regulator|uniref:LacI family DNA-binding transcriptional regulator n=1 Tax=Bacillus sp. N1-1 TaxID=2682541 RepID=UPI001316019B|nr:LacI family DNA-binding transcriptional regulator [Bacillus sp. N1-1]QHA91349.1 substrate-binding domain-containing protein [Bacillus sp. N1-1]
MATIKDIAKAAGVSVTTVSRALNGYSDVSERTRKKIKQIADDLSYSPNALARSLVMNKTKTIGLLVSGISREGAKDNIVFEVLTGVNEYCGHVDYDIVLFNTSSSQQKQKTYTQLCRERRVDGVVIQGIKNDDPYLMEVVESDIPCVLVDIPIQGDTVGYVATDNVAGAKEAVQHLVDLGHRQIGMINGHDRAFVSQERIQGYQDGLESNHLPYKEELVYNGGFSEKQAEEAAVSLLNTLPETSAIFCASDLMAFGVMRAAKRVGRKVPEELSIIGYDNIILSSYVTPSLTTISQDMFQIGYSAAELLIDLLEGGNPPRSKIVSHELVVRESTCQRSKQ